MNIIKMKKRIFALILTGLLIFAVAGCSGDDGNGNGYGETSGNPDPLVIPDYITIQGEQFSTSLTELDLSERGLTDSDIEPLKYMVNLTELYLFSNQINNLAPLTGLINLISISLADNQISDLTPLAELTNLTGLMLHINQITDLSPLSNFTNLKWLNLSDNKISSITPLLELTNLEYLNLRANAISDWSPVSHILEVLGRP